MSGMQSRSLLVVAVVLSALLTAAIAGCASPTQPAQPSAGVTGTPVPTQSPGEGQISDISPVDAALVSGPAFIEFGAVWCHWCQVEKPITEQLSKDYPGVAFFSVDTDSSPGFARAFYVSSIPQMAIVVKKNSDGGYLYVGPDGKTGTDRYKARIVGYRTYDQLKPLLDAALAARE